MRGLIRAGVVVGTFATLGLFVALMSADVSIEAFDEPGTPGKFAVQFALTIALVLGWAFGAAIEQTFREGEGYDAPWQVFLVGVVSRVTVGLVLFFVVVGIEIGFEALGFGLGAK